jgi:arylsulfatase A-like enzyme
VTVPSPPPPRQPIFRIAALVAAVVAAAAGLWWVSARPARRPNLLLVTIDTLRADRVGVYGYGPAATPVMDALAGRGARFARAEASIPLTGPSHATILTGQYPPVHGVRDNVVFPLGDRHPTLAALLKRQDYRTAAFVAAYPVAASFGFAQGFDAFDEGFHESALPGEGAERPGNEVADAALKWIGAHTARPFFLWVHFYDPHTPYRPPPDYAAAFPGRLYDAEVAFTDSQLGRVLDGLRAQGRLEDTVVAVVADHGESLGDHGEQTHRRTRSWSTNPPSTCPCCWPGRACRRAAWSRSPWGPWTSRRPCSRWRAPRCPKAFPDATWVPRSGASGWAPSPSTRRACSGA